MKKLHFSYDMLIEYSDLVSHCNFTIKCIPADTARQRIENLRLSLEPEVEYQRGVDGFGNRYIWGKNSTPHTTFRFCLEGDAQTGYAGYEEVGEPGQNMLFAHPHGLNRAGQAICEFHRKTELGKDLSVLERVLELSRLLSREFRYESGSTDVNTTAEDAFLQGCGVCQDYAHILIALLHLSGIPARYVTGFIIGEGKSHAWVEFLEGNRWIGADPTHNTLVRDDYIKIGHGRDAADCMINRGIMRGGGDHTQMVHVLVTESGKE